MKIVFVPETAKGDSVAVAPWFSFHGVVAATVVRSVTERRSVAVRQELYHRHLGGVHSKGHHLYAYEHFIPKGKARMGKGQQSTV